MFTLQRTGHPARGAITIRTGPEEYEGWISRSDLLTAGKLVCCVAAALGPQRYWPALARLLARAQLALRGSERMRVARACEHQLRIDPAQLELQVTAGEYEENMEAIRELLPGGWRRRIVLHGAASIESARHQGRGVVLWVSRFAHSDLVTKRALGVAGYKLSQLSHPRHPFSATWAGRRFLNWVRVLAENRYLEQRVLVCYGQAQPALEALAQVLRNRGIVAVTALGSGKKAVTVPLLEGKLRLAIGAPRLALDTGAALIPVFTVPDGEGGYAVHCGPDINVEPAGSTREEAVRRLAGRYVELLEPFVRAQPASWKGWFTLSWQPEPAPGVRAANVPE